MAPCPFLLRDLYMPPFPRILGSLPGGLGSLPLLLRDNYLPSCPLLLCNLPGGLGSLALGDSHGLILLPYFSFPESRIEDVWLSCLSLEDCSLALLLFLYVAFYLPQSLLPCCVRASCWVPPSASVVAGA